VNTNDIKHLAVETIYLVPDASEGTRCYLWCDDPAPGIDMDPAEAVEYLRKDVHNTIIAKQAKAAISGMNAAKMTERIAELEQREAALAEHVIAIMDARDSKRGDTLENMLAVLNGGPTPLDSLARRDLGKRAEGTKMAALFIELKAYAYDEEHGTTDPSTGTREYPGDGAEYYNNLMELAEELHKQAEGHQ